MKGMGCNAFRSWMHLTEILKDPVTPDSKALEQHTRLLDRARELNERITTLPTVYYFSVPCSFTVKNSDGTWRPKPGIEPLFVMRASQIGTYTGKTAGGMIIDETWRENDGLVNTVSAAVPTGAPSRPLDRDKIDPGHWNVFPTVDGDHMWLQGGLLHRHNIRPFYLELLTIIRELPDTGSFGGDELLS